MIRTVALWSMLLGSTTAWAQFPIDPGMPPQVGGPMYQLPMSYPQAMPYPGAMPQPYYSSPYPGGYSPYGGFAPLGNGYGGYGYGGIGYGGYGLGSYGLGGFGYGRFGYGGYGFGARGYYPPNPFGNLNMLPPNPPSPYYVVPSAAEYRAQSQRLDQAKFGELILQHSLQQPK